MPNYELTSPIYLTLLGVYFIVSSLKMFDIRMTQARIGKFGSQMAEIARTEPPLPGWIAIIYWFDWLVAGILFILNWKITIVVWIIRFLLKVLPVLETFGNFFMRPFRPKRPLGVLDEHLEIASAIIALDETSPENKEVWIARYEKMQEVSKNISGSNEDQQALVDSIKFLGGGPFTDYSEQSAAELCEQRRHELETHARESRGEETDGYFSSLNDEV